MKNVIISAAMALFAMSASAQSSSASNEHGKSVSSGSRETTLEGREKGKSISELAKSKSDNEYRPYDLNQDGKLSSEEKAARKAGKRAEAKSRKADRSDDGLLNGSAGDKAIHGQDVSAIAKGTQLERREKGAAVSDVARSKAKNTERVRESAGKRPANVGRPVTAGKPASARGRGR